MAIFGNNAADAATDGTGSYRLASSFTASESGTITALAALLGNFISDDTVYVAVYTDNGNKPGALVCSYSVLLADGGDTELVSGSATGAIVNGTKYWFVVAAAGGDAHGFHVGTSVGGSFDYMPGDGLPADNTWTSEGTHSGNTVCAYATYTPSGGGTDSTQTPGGFGLTASLGTAAVLKSGVRVSPTGFGLTASRGTPTINGGSTQIPNGFGLAASLGTPAVLRSGVQISPTGFGLTASRGTPSVSVGGPTLTPTGFGLVVSLGTFTTQNDITLTSIAGFGLSASLGAPTLSIGRSVAPSGFGLVVSLGMPAVLKSGVLVAPAGFALVTGLGTPTVTVGGPLILPAGFALAVTLGTPLTHNDIVRAVSGFGLSTALGAPAINTTANITITPSGLAIVTLLGTPFVDDGSGGVLTQLSEPLYIDFDPLTTRIAFVAGGGEMFTLELIAGEVVPIVMTLTGQDTTGAFVPHDLTGASAMTITVYKPGEEPIIDAATLEAVGSPSAGRVTFTPAPGETVGGRYNAIAEVVYPASPDNIVRKFPGRVVIRDAVA